MSTTIATEHHHRLSFAVGAAAAGVFALAGIAYAVQSGSDSSSPPGGNSSPVSQYHGSPATTSGGHVMRGE